MTAQDVFGAVLRRFYVIALGLALTGMLIVHLNHNPGVFSARTNVVFFAPTSTLNPNTMEVTSLGLIATASVVERAVNRGQDLPRVTSPTIRLIDQGVTNGSSVYLPNDGSQWVVNYGRAMLVVDVAGPDIPTVKSRTRHLVAEIEGTLRRMQVQQHVKRKNRITAQAAPATPQVTYDQGKPHVAEAAAFLLGTGLTTAAAAMFDQAILSRRRRKLNRGREPVPTTVTA